MDNVPNDVLAEFMQSLNTYIGQFESDLAKRFDMAKDEEPDEKEKESPPHDDRYVWDNLEEGITIVPPGEEGEDSAIVEDDFKEADHPRGQPGNAGQFASAPGGGSSSGKQKLTGKETFSAGTQAAQSFLKPHGFKPKYKIGEHTVVFKNEKNGSKVHWNQKDNSWKFHEVGKIAQSKHGKDVNQLAAAMGISGTPAKPAEQPPGMPVTPETKAKVGEPVSAAAPIAPPKHISSMSSSEILNKLGFTQTATQSKDMIKYELGNGSYTLFATYNNQWSIYGKDGSSLEHGQGWDNLGVEVLDIAKKGDLGLNAEVKANQMSATPAPPKPSTSAPAKPATSYNPAAQSDVFKQYSDLCSKVPKPTPQQQTALYKYTGSGYTAINKALRHSGGSGYESTIKQLDAYLAGAKLDQDLTVFRGIGGEFAKHLLSVIGPGAKVYDKGYGSTSISKNTASGFGGNMLMEIKLKKGQRAAAVGGLSEHSGEREVILPRNCAIVVVEYDQHSGYIKAEIDQKHLGYDQVPGEYAGQPNVNKPGFSGEGEFFYLS